MAFMPKRVKYRKHQRMKTRGLATRGSALVFGEFGLKVLENGWLKNTQIESVRVVLSRQLKRGGRMWVRTFPDHSVSKKPAETRQGKGKGEVDHCVARVKRGKVLFEIGGVPKDFACSALRLAAYKLPFRTKFISRQSA